MGISLAVLSAFAGALLAPVVARLAGRATGCLLALLPLALLAYFLTGVTSEVVAQGRLVVSLTWAPQLGVAWSFYVDGLALLAAVLVTGIGPLVLVYSGGYLAGQPRQGTFFASLLMFAGSMLGLVLAGNVLTLYVFWELTSISSFLLIGFEHQRQAAREAAVQALVVTVAGGLALLAGLVLAGQAVGSYELADLLQRGDALRESRVYLPVLLLVAAGAFTKSAQFPFHFWLPSAMEAPTPVSAYLHSATMVTAGVYVLARLRPVLGGTDAWFYLLATVGGLTMVAGALLAMQKRDLKQVLAYSTVSALGMMVLLLGLPGPLAAQAALVFLTVHALYKAALFLLAGAVDHAAGTRDIDQLGGLGRAMPWTALSAVAAAVSMASLPPTIGFIAKELFYNATLEAPLARAITAAAVLANALFVAVAGLVTIGPFLGKSRAPRKPHEAAVDLWLPAGLLAAAGVILGLMPGLIEKPWLAAAWSSVAVEPGQEELKLWHGLTPELALTAVTVAAGVMIYLGRRPWRRTMSLFGLGADWGPRRFYELSLRAVNSIAHWQTRVLQNGYLRSYLLMILVTTVLLAAWAGWRWNRLRPPASWPTPYFYELGIALLMALAAGWAVVSGSRFGAIAGLGVVGYGVAIIFVMFGAPDLAMTQFLIETVTVILFVLAFYRLPPLAVYSSRAVRVRDALVALAVGGVMTFLVLASSQYQFHPPISDYYLEHALQSAHGRNVVNVILVDFRALDTLGEITVLMAAGAGVYALLKRRPEKKGDG